MTIDEIRDNFELLEEWDDRYRYVIELGRTLAPMPEAEHSAANKVNGIRAAMCVNQTLARYARQHNGANVLALGSTLVTIDDAMTIVDAFLDTSMREPRYMRRLAKIRDLE